MASPVTYNHSAIGHSLSDEQSIKKLRSLFMQAPAAIALLEGPHHIYTFANPLYQKIFSRTEEQLIGKTPKMVFPEIEGQGIYEIFDRVYDTKEPFIASEFPATFRDCGVVKTGYYNFVVQPVENEAGEVTDLMIHVYEVSKQVEAHKKTAESESKYQTLFHSIDDGFCTIEVLFDEKGKPFNYRFLEVNKAFEQQTGLTSAVGLTMNDFARLEDFWYETYGNVAVTGEAVRFENRAENLHRFYDVYAFKVGNVDERKVAVLFTDITERKVAQQKLQETASLLQTVFDSAPNGIAVMQPVYGEKGKVEDFAILLFNAYTLNWIGNTDYKGKRYGDLFPMVKQTGILERFIEVAETGVSASFESWYAGEGMKHWFRFMAVKQDQLLVVTTEDITEQKNAEESIKQSEERSRTMIDQAPVATCLFIGRELKIEMANDIMIRYWGKGASVIGKPLAEALPELKGQPFLQQLNEIFTTRKAVEVKEALAELITDGVPGTYYFDYSYKPLFNEKGEVYGIMDMAADVTEQVVARKKLEESESRFRSMADASPMMIWTLDAEGNSVYYNKTATDFTGHTEQEIKDGRTWQTAIHPDDVEFAAGVVGNAVQNRQPYQMECRMKRADSEWRWLLSHGVPRLGKNNQLLGYVGSSVDITEHKKSQQELQTALEQVRLSKEAAELGTFDMDLEKGTMHWDDRCRILFGISHHAPVTYEKDFAGGLHPDDRERVLKLIDRLFIKSISDGDYDVEYRTVGAEDGIIRWVRAKGKVYFNEQKKPIRFIGSVLDITEKVTAIQRIEALVEERTKELAQANETLQKTNKELQRSNQNLEEFAHAASHDLKEPVRKIHFFTNQLKEQLSTQLQESQARAFSRIESATERMGNLIDDLLLYSHVSQRPHETEAVDLNQKVQRVLEDLELDIEEKKAVFQVDKLPTIRGYRRQLQQLFQNLISNALKYSKNDIPPRIDITAKSFTENGKLYHLIEVKDNGIGFQPEYADKIFQMFTRLHGKAEYSGTGVGLSIVKKVVENHNGFIAVESAVGIGSVFKIYLPD